MKNVINRDRPSFQLEYVGRPGSAAPAGGYMALHTSRQDLLVKQALGLAEND
jgi:2-oxoglutarate dehydrogenase E1 component